MITRLRELGVNISIDDYGTGLSTLDYLKKIPATEIKIDQSFVKGVADNRSDRLMVQSTVSLAHSLGRKVVAEGARASGHSRFPRRDELRHRTGLRDWSPDEPGKPDALPDLRPQARRGLTTQAKLGSCTEAVHFFARPLWLPVY